MTVDPVVREVREIRHQIEQEYKQDAEKYYQHLMTYQKNLAERLVCRQPKSLVSSKKKAG